jgi:hypothetical protein
VKNQQSLEPELLQIKAREKIALLALSQSRDKASSENLSRSAPGAQAKLADSREAGAAPLSAAAPGAFCTGIVKNQQGSATELL